MSNEGWSLTESDPGIFTGIISELGCPSIQVNELWGLDSALLSQLAPIHSLIFLFKWVGGIDPAKVDGTLQEPAGRHYFARQVIGNACATIALLNSLLNIEDVAGDKLELGEELSNLKDFSEGLDPETRGWTISNSEKIRQVHNSFARSDPFHLEESRPQDEDEDAYHFIAYLPIGNQLYELDGLKPLPICHGVIPEPLSHWTDLAREVIERRISTYPSTEVHFNLMAINSNQAFLMKEEARLSKEVEDGTKSGKATSWLEEELREVKEKIEKGEEQGKEWEAENTLRRHNYVGLIHQLMLELAKKGELKGRVEDAKEVMKKRLEDAKEVMKKRLEERKAKGQAGVGNEAGGMEE